MMTTFQRPDAPRSARVSAATLAALWLGACASSGAFERASSEAEAARLAVRSISEDAGRGSDLVRRTLLAVEAVRRAPMPETVAALWAAVDELPTRTMHLRHGLGSDQADRHPVAHALAVGGGCGAVAAVADGEDVPADRTALWLWSEEAGDKTLLLETPHDDKAVSLSFAPDDRWLLAQVGCDVFTVEVAEGRVASRWQLQDTCARSAQVAWPEADNGDAAPTVWASDGCVFEVYDPVRGERLARHAREEGCSAATAVSLDPAGGWVATVVPRGEERARLIVWRVVDGLRETLVDVATSPTTRLELRGHLLGTESDQMRGDVAEVRARLYDLRDGHLVLDEIAPEWLNPDWAVDETEERVLYRTFSPGEMFYQAAVEASFLSGEVYAAHRGRGLELFMGVGFVGGDGPAYVAKNSGTFITLDTPPLPGTEGGLWRARAELPEWSSTWAVARHEGCFAAFGPSMIGLVDARPHRWAVTLYAPEETENTRGILLRRSGGGRFKAIWRPAQGLDVLETATEQPPSWPEPPASLQTVDFDPEDRWVVAGMSDGSVRRWRAEPNATWEVVVPPAAEREDGRDRPFAHAPSGRLLLGGEREVQVLDANTLRPRGTPLELVRTPREIAVSPKGDAIALAYDGGRLELRSWPQGRPLSRLQWPDAKLTHLRMQEDGTLALRRESWEERALIEHNVELVWDPGALVEMACRRVPRNLTEAEWSEAFGRKPYRRTCPDVP